MWRKAALILCLVAMAAGHGTTSHKAVTSGPNSAHGAAMGSTCLLVCACRRRQPWTATHFRNHVNLLTRFCVSMLGKYTAGLPCFLHWTHIMLSLDISGGP